MNRTEDETPFGGALLEGLREAVAWKRGEVALPVRNAPSLTAERVKAIRKSVAKTSREFSRRFGIPVRTLEGWEQGRRQPDPAASVLLRVIERNPKAVEEVVGEG
ncbi:MAG: transcriptional regulator [Roseiarcus sp.]